MNRMVHGTQRNMFIIKDMIKDRDEESDEGSIGEVQKGSQRRSCQPQGAGVLHSPHKEMRSPAWELSKPPLLRDFHGDVIAKA